jgi:hypothetical protein
MAYQVLLPPEICTYANPEDLRLAFGTDSAIVARGPDYLITHPFNPGRPFLALHIEDGAAGATAAGDLATRAILSALETGATLYLGGDDDDGYPIVLFVAQPGSFVGEGGLPVSSDGKQPPGLYRRHTVTDGRWHTYRWDRLCDATADALHASLAAEIAELPDHHRDRIAYEAALQARLRLNGTGDDAAIWSP